MKKLIALSSYLLSSTIAIAAVPEDIPCPSANLIHHAAVHSFSLKQSPNGDIAIIEPKLPFKRHEWSLSVGPIPAAYPIDNPAAVQAYLAQAQQEMTFAHFPLENQDQDIVCTYQTLEPGVTITALREGAL